MTLGPDFGGFDPLAMPRDIAGEFSALERGQVHAEFLSNHGGLFMGDAQFFAVGSPFLHDCKVHILSEPIGARPTLRRISFNKFMDTEQGNDEGAVLSLPFESGSATVFMRDYLFDLSAKDSDSDIPRLRAAQNSTSKGFDGQWKMDAKKPTLLEHKKEQETLLITRGAMHEAELMSLPLLQSDSEVNVMRELLRLGKYLNPVFQETVTLQIRLARNDVE